jgi:HEAT repeats
MWLLIIVVIVIVVIWWLKSERTLSRNERLYLKRRGYQADPVDVGPPVDPDSQLFSLINSLSDISPYARQRAAEELSKLCAGGKRDPRMYESLVEALDDNEPAVRSAVAAALGSLEDVRAIAPLEQQLEVDESILFRTSARRALDKLKGG